MTSIKDAQEVHAAVKAHQDRVTALLSDDPVKRAPLYFLQSCHALEDRLKGYLADIRAGRA